MIKISEVNIEYLRKYIDNLDSLITSEDVYELLDPINDVIISTMLNNEEDPDEPTELGKQLQKIWDNIYYDNIA